MGAKNWDGELSGDDDDNDEDDDKGSFEYMFGGLRSLGGGGFLSEFLGEDLGGLNKEKQFGVEAKGEVQESRQFATGTPAPRELNATYQQLVIYSERKNGGKVERKVVEKAWEAKCKALYEQWKIRPETTRKDRRLALPRAISQVSFDLQ